MQARRITAPAPRPSPRLPARGSRTCAAWLLLALSALAAAPFPAIAADPATATPPPDAAIDDGPYAFRDADGVHALWVCAGHVVREQAQPRRDGSVRLPERCGYPHPLQVQPPRAPALGVVPATARIVALSDIHGQYGLMRRLLRANGVIDAQDRWSLGRDTLVVAGDVFDRGPQVTEVFWLLYGLQQQAAAAGGAVHFVLGNHETMTLYDDLRYLHPKYVRVAQLLGRPYPALFGADTVLGQWLRTRPALLRVGDTLFLHGGIAPQNLDLVQRQAETNADYRRSLGMPRADVKQDPVLSRLYDGKTSPIWYRGYFNGELDGAAVAALVQALGVKRIVVGHTSMEHISSFHDGRVIAIDSSIKNGESGELLFIEGERLSRGMPDGSRQPLAEGGAPAD